MNMNGIIKTQIEACARGNIVILAAMFTCVFSWAIADATAAAEGEVTLVVDGSPKAVIVLPDGTSHDSVERQAAQLLADHVRQMSGARLEIVEEAEIAHTGNLDRLDEPGAVEGSGDPENVVLIGESNFVKRMGISSSDLGVAGIRLKSTENAVVLLGGPSSEPGARDPGGVWYAAVELLERLGFRYLWPGESGKVVPDKATVTVPSLDVAYTPSIKMRHMRMRWGPDSGVSIATHSSAERAFEWMDLPMDQWERGFEKAAHTESPVLWTRWQRLSYALRSDPNREYYFGHNGAGLGNGPIHRGRIGRLYESHPNWFAMQGDGTRNNTIGQNHRWRLCKSNPDLREHVAERIIEQKKRNPDLGLVSLSPNDGSSQGWCLCDDCRALDSEHAPMITIRILEPLGNEAPLPPPAGERIEVVTEYEEHGLQRTRIEYPSLTDRKVNYWNEIAERVTEVHPDLRFGVDAYSDFSHAPVRETVHPNLVPRYVRPGRDEWAGWENAGAKHLFWRPNLLHLSRPGRPMSIIEDIAETMQYFAEAGMKQTDFDSIIHNWAGAGLTYYATARLHWNPHLSAEEIIDDYARHGFGAGSDDVKSYFMRLEELTDDLPDYWADPVWASPIEGPTAQILDTIADLQDMLNNAEQAALDDGDDKIVDRIAFLRLGLNMTDLWSRLDEKAGRADKGLAVDMDYARRLMDLNALAMRDIILNHHFAFNFGRVVGHNRGFERWEPLESDRDARLHPSDPELLERVGEDDGYGLTGRERSIEDMLKAFDL